MECKQPANLEKCPCTSDTCERRGYCCECLSNHLARQTLPACCFPNGVFEGFGRSFEGFAKAWKIID